MVKGLDGSDKIPSQSKQRMPVPFGNRPQKRYTDEAAGRSPRSPAHRRWQSATTPLGVGSPSDSITIDVAILAQALIFEIKGLQKHVDVRCEQYNTNIHATRAFV